MTASYDRLDNGQVCSTVARLEARIRARFDGRHLADVAAQLSSLVEQIGVQNPATRRRIRTTRVASRVLMVVLVIGAIAAFAAAANRDLERQLDWLPLIESAVNDLVFAGIAVFFLWSLPERLHRAELLAQLHRLRSLAHVIDMHQLTKDPERLRPGFSPTPQSPPLALELADLEHYLDYCSEMLSLVGKSAALVAEESRDAVVLETVGGIETLTTNLSTKIWNKIGVLATIRSDGTA